VKRCWLVLALVAGLLAACKPSSSAPVPSSSATASSSSACDASLWQHVYHPYRLHVIEECKTVAGTVEAIRAEPDGDYHILLRPDQARIVNSVNVAKQHGDLVIEPVCENPVTQPDAVVACQGYTSSIIVPPVGTHVFVTGSYVLDADHGWLEIHPVTSIAIRRG